MKCTILANTDGTVLITVSHASEKVFIGELRNIERVGNIYEQEGTFSVEFVPSNLQQFNKKGFSDYTDAIAYEQDILDANLA